LSYRDRGSVIRVIVTIIRINEATVGKRIEFPLKKMVVVNTDIKISAMYSAIKKIENKVP